MILFIYSILVQLLVVKQQEFSMESNRTTSIEKDFPPDSFFFQMPFNDEDLFKIFDYDQKMMIQLFEHLHRPLVKHFRPRQTNTKEWFDMQSKIFIQK